MAAKESQYTYNEEQLVSAMEDLIKVLRAHKIASLYPAVEQAVMHAESSIKTVKARKGIK